ncbi:hypothetical protein [Ralstonia mannitolilytica]|uniref:hypothetical protein n=1 Tax=Ralstonia mannitolilytica TaxID=105219 RepID=UPI0026F24AD0|nr:hypothetical protein [Ralstonia mannitolilytica]
MEDERILRTLRMQAWALAKGELNAVLQTFWDGHGKDDQFKTMDKAVSDFIAHVEDHGLAE